MSASKEIVNSRLHTLFGNHVETDMPLFRVAFSEDEWERREGEFYESEAGIVYPSPVREIRTVPKYGYMENQWVLEILTFVPPNREISSGYTYEPLWAWDTGKPLNWNAVERVVYAYLNKVKSSNPKNQKECDYVESEKLKRAKAVVKNRLDNTALASALHDGAATSLAGVDVESAFRRK